VGVGGVVGGDRGQDLGGGFGELVAVVGVGEGDQQVGGVGLLLVGEVGEAVEDGDLFQLKCRNFGV
jgi:hypothetical protein